MATIKRTIEEKLSRRDNFYGNIIPLARKNEKKTTCSVIIPVYNQSRELDFCLRALNRQVDPPLFEVIILDDASKKRINQSMLRDFHFPVRLFRLSKNLGASTARNIGVYYAKNPILVFLDADMIVPRNFLLAHARMHPPKSSNISVGLREAIHLSKAPHAKRKANYKRDFRYRRFVENEWHQDYPWLPKSLFGKIYSPLNSSHQFKTYGMGRRIGIWTLPHMVLTSSMAVRKSRLIRVGAFNERFPGSWYEDTFVGAKLIANGAKVIPLRNITAWHVIRNKENMDSKKRAAIKKNRKLYYALLKDKIKLENKRDFLKRMKPYARIAEEVF